MATANNLAPKNSDWAAFYVFAYSDYYPAFDAEGSTRYKDSLVKTPNKPVYLILNRLLQIPAQSTKPLFNYASVV